jgi:hypothetical protein
VIKKLILSESYDMVLKEVNFGKRRGKEDEREGQKSY